MKTVLLDSKNATANGYKYEFDMPLGIENPDNIKINRVIISNPFYTVTPATSICLFANNVMTTFIAVNVNQTIPTGNYTATTLAAALQTQLQLTDATYTCAFDPLTSKFTIARGAGNFELRAQLNPYNADLFGFNRTAHTGAATYTSDKLPILNRTNYITMHSEKIGRAINYFKHTDFRSGIVDMIPIYGSFGDIIPYESYENKKILQISGSNERLYSFDVYFVDEYGFKVDFQGLKFLIEMIIFKTPFVSGKGFANMSL